MLKGDLYIALELREVTNGDRNVGGIHLYIIGQFMRKYKSPKEQVHIEKRKNIQEHSNVDSLKK